MNDEDRASLPAELRRLVSQAVAVLGEVVRDAEGPALYRRIEGVRRDMAGLRGARADRAEAMLAKHLARFRTMAQAERFAFAHAFSLMLELMNACENAYRTHRLRRRAGERPERGPRAVVYVLTAHPTEARSPRTIALFHDIQGTLVDALEQGFDRHEPALRHLLALAWHVGSARRRKPRVEDEAEHLYSIALRDETLGALLDASRELVPVYVRTWVGGDKDGHPGVDEVRMRNSLLLSRARLVRYAEGLLADVRRASRLVPSAAARVEPATRRLARRLRQLRALRHGDGAKSAELREETGALRAAYVEAVGAPHPAIARLEQLVRMFPALVVPLELRETAELVVRAADGEPLAIARMIRELERISRGGDPRWYARGLILSMVESFDHVRAAAKLVTRELGGLRIQVIPLFEQGKALADAPAVVRAMLADRAIRRAVDEHWRGYFEVMLGYSDSAKEMGVLASRLAISDAVTRLDRMLRKAGTTPLFFHGSGGSVDRGGGSIQEQTAWWPKSALMTYKATLQGEMVERSLASPEIARGRLERIVERAREGSDAHPAPSPEVVRAFAERASLAYRQTIASPSFLAIVQRATAYRYLSVLRLGSRPARRGPMASVQSLRAIPWVLSWTQVRVLFPTWWGIGTAWRELGARERAALRVAYEADAVFRSFVKNLGFTLAKVELPVFAMYLGGSGLPPALRDETLRDLAAELRDAEAFVRAMSQSRDLLWFRPWLGTSITLRSPMIHPLNLLQIVALEEDDAALIRETVTGIASGMLTTG